MRNVKYQPWLLVLLITTIVILDSCLNEDADALRTPTITIISNNLEVRQGASANLIFKVDAPEGIKQLTIDGVSISLNLIKPDKEVEYEYPVSFNHPLGKKSVEVKLIDTKQQTAQGTLALEIIEYPEIKFFPVQGVLADTIIVSQSDVNLANAKVFLGDSLMQIIEVKDNKLYVVVPYFIKEQEAVLKLVIGSSELFAKEKFKVQDPIVRAIDGMAVYQTNQDALPLIIAHESGSVAHFFGKDDFSEITGLMIEHDGVRMFAKYEVGKISRIYTTIGLFLIENYRKDTVDIAFIDSNSKVQLFRNHVIPNLAKLLDQASTGRVANVEALGQIISKTLFAFDIIGCGVGIASIPVSGGYTILNTALTCASAFNTAAGLFEGKNSKTLESSEVAIFSTGVDLIDPEKFNVNCVIRKGECIKGLVNDGLKIAGDLLTLFDETTTAVSNAKEELSKPCAITVSSSIDSKGTTITLVANGGTPPYSYSLNNSTFQPGNTFANQKEGFHFYSVKDKNGCFKSGEATLAVKNECEGVFITFEAKMDKDGVIKITDVVGGVEPYEYSVANSSFQLVPIFDNGYKEGSFKIEVKDSKGCTGARVINLKPESSLELPTVTTTSITNTTSTGATGGGEVTNDGGSPVTTRGVVWSTSTEPTVSLSTKTTNGTGTGAFTSSITDLEANTKYYVRAYATTTKGTGYGDEVTFTTTAISLPSITTTAISSIAANSATSGGNITNDGGSDVTARGIVWSTSTQPTIALITKTTNGTGAGAFTSSITNLTANTKYYVRAYATTSKGTGYGNEVVFTTTTQPLAIITTIPITSITSNAATSGGNITNDGGAPITARGVVWSTSTQPTTNLTTKTTNGTGTGVFSSSITYLQANTKYYVRAYATNSNGTSYGNEVEFTTTVLSLPTITTTEISLITTNSASSGGNIINDGGSPITARGVVWSTSTQPTIALTTKTTNGTGTGAFISLITNLQAFTKYFVRAYATNLNGTTYGNEFAFTTAMSSIVDPRDGQIYKVVQIGSQYWFAENLRYSGNVPHVSGDTNWARHWSPGNMAWCWYDDNPTNDLIYGKLYNWWAMKNGNLCPLGWHIPTTSEWIMLHDFLGVYAGKRLISDTEDWIPWDSGWPVVKNDSGFSGRPGGVRDGYGLFSYAGRLGRWWSSTENKEPPYGLTADLWYQNGFSVGTQSGSHKSNALSCRCLKD